jgi:hypothetical protein
VKVGQRIIQQHITPDASIEIHELDLKSFTSVKSFAKQVLYNHDQIHILVNNGKLYNLSYYLLLFSNYLYKLVYR